MCYRRDEVGKQAGQPFKAVVHLGHARRPALLIPRLARADGYLHVAATSCEEARLRGTRFPNWDYKPPPAPLMLVHVRAYCTIIIRKAPQ